MERRYEARLEEMLAQAEVSPEMFQGLRKRLEAFVEPYAASLQEPEQRRHAAEYVSGLLSRLEHKTSEGIAYLHNQERQGLQKFLGLAPWDHQPLARTLARQVGDDLGEEDAVLVFDPSAFPKKGTKSVGVARQWCGRLGKVENCQVGVFMAYVSRKEQTLVNVRLYLPKEWTQDRERRQEAGIPKEVRFRTRHALALEMLDECAAQLPHAWIAGDDEMGRPSGFREQLRGRGERYLLAVPSNTLVRDLEAEPPEYGGRGRPPQRPWVRVDRWCAALPDDAWTTLEVRDGEKGPLVVEVVTHRVQARAERGGAGLEELLFITRERQADLSFKHDYYLSNAAPHTPQKELARVAKAAHRIEECLERAKGEAGLADYQVRTWVAWHRHQILALLAAWFLNQETRRGKNPDARVNDPASADADRGTDRSPPAGPRIPCSVPPQHPLAATQRTSPPLSPSLT
jgi:SRSO17 transposase